MKKIILSLLIISVCGFVATGQTADKILAKTLSQYNKSSGISANYSVSSPQGSNFGSIQMKGKMFSISSPELKCWFNGKTMWTYAAANGEVNITNPTIEELQMSNPYSALSSYKALYNASLVLKESNRFTIRLLPKKKNSDVSQITLNISSKGYLIEKATIKMRNKSILNVVINNYKTNVKLANNIFVFNKNSVPKRAQIIDLR